MRIDLGTCRRVVKHAGRRLPEPMVKIFPHRGQLAFNASARDEYRLAWRRYADILLSERHVLILLRSEPGPNSFRILTNEGGLESLYCYVFRGQDMALNRWQAAQTAPGFDYAVMVQARATLDLARVRFVAGSEVPFRGTDLRQVQRKIPPHLTVPAATIRSCRIDFNPPAMKLFDSLGWNEDMEIFVRQGSIVLAFHDAPDQNTYRLSRKGLSGRVQVSLAQRAAGVSRGRYAVELAERSGLAVIRLDKPLEVQP